MVRGERGDARTYLFSLAFQVFPKCQHIVLKGMQGGRGSVTTHSRRIHNKEDLSINY